MQFIFTVLFANYIFYFSTGPGFVFLRLRSLEDFFFEKSQRKWCFQTKRFPQPGRMRGDNMNINEDTCLSHVETVHREI